MTVTDGQRLFRIVSKLAAKRPKDSAQMPTLEATLADRKASIEGKG